MSVVVLIIVITVITAVIVPCLIWKRYSTSERDGTSSLRSFYGRASPGDGRRFGEGGYIKEGRF